ncbi:MAG: hypothetical protein KBC17_01975 [Candidatus Pacebacteria bacterium]|nr:hypothetical protein [Candidatus Paceibacterota bacterium]
MKNIYFTFRVSWQVEYVFTSWIVLVFQDTKSQYKDIFISFNAYDKVGSDSIYLLKLKNIDGEKIRAWLNQFEETWANEIDDNKIKKKIVSEEIASAYEKRRLN